jgi:hypothetical protein
MIIEIILGFILVVMFILMLVMLLFTYMIFTDGTVKCPYCKKRQTDIGYNSQECIRCKKEFGVVE